MTTDPTKAPAAPHTHKALTAEEKIKRAEKSTPKVALLDLMNKAELRAYASDHGIKLSGGNAAAWRESIRKAGKEPK